jgi:hypothetical protein
MNRHKRQTANSVAIASLFCLCAVSLQSILLGSLYLSDILRPFIFFAFSFLLYKHALAKRLIFPLFIVAFVVGIFQAVIVVFQYIMPDSLLLKSISLYFASPELLDLSLRSSRATGIFGGPSASGVFCLVAILIAIISRNFVLRSGFLVIVFILLQVAVCFLMASKLALYVSLAIFLRELLLYVFIKFRHFLRARFLVINMALSFLLVGAPLFAFSGLDIISMRSQGGLSLLASNSLRTSSLSARLGYHSDNVFIQGGPLEILLGLSAGVSANTKNRVFDSDLLYFFNAYGLSGVVLYVALVSVAFQASASAGLGVICSSLVALYGVFNPFYSSLAPLPFLLAFFSVGFSLPSLRS